MANYESKRAQMYSYLDELNAIQGDSTVHGERYAQWFDGLVESVYDGYTDWITLQDKQGQYAGELLIGKRPNCHPDADYYIEEAFTVKSARRKGIMTAAVTEYVKSHPGIYCYFVLTKNHAAARFWDKVFISLGYEPIELRDVGAGDPDVVQRGYKQHNVDKLDQIAHDSIVSLHKTT